jgi:hypothetical protein
MAEFDYVLVGGGLQNGLIATALRKRQPESRIALIEREGALGGNHTWCFHGTDVASASRDWLERLVVHAWPGYLTAATRPSRARAWTKSRLPPCAEARVRSCF